MGWKSKREGLAMGFMQPQLVHGQWIEIDGPNGIDFVPADVVGHVDEYEGPEIDTPESVKDYTENERVYSIKKVKGWGCRLSAPGYMDCTPWCVFETPLEAIESLLENYGDDEADVQEIKEHINISDMLATGVFTEDDRPRLEELELIDISNTAQVVASAISGHWRTDNGRKKEVRKAHTLARVQK